MMEPIVKYGATNSVGMEDETEYHIAARKGDLKRLESLLKDEAYITKINATNKKGETALFVAAQREGKDLSMLHSDVENKNKIAIVKLLLEHGVNVHARNKDGETVFHTASRNNQISMMPLFLRHGVNIDVRNRNGDTACHISTAYSYGIRMTKFLLEHGTNVNAENKDGERIIHVAAHTGRRDMLALLLRYGANINIDAVNKKGETAAHIVARQDELEMMQLLLQHQADVNTTNMSGETPCHLVAKYSQTSELLELLLKHGADLCATNRFGKTVLHIACGRHRRIKGQMSKRGPAYRNYEGLTLSDILANTLALRHACVAHNVKLKIAGLCMVTDGLFYVVRAPDSGSLHNLTKRCRREIAKMKSKKIGGSIVTLRDFVAKSAKQLVVHMKNTHIVRALESGAYKEEYPIYSHMITNNFERARKRNGLLKSCFEPFRSLLSSSLNCVLPHTFVQDVLYYVSDCDLMNITEACSHYNS